MARDIAVCPRAWGWLDDQRRCCPYAPAYSLWLLYGPCSCGGARCVAASKQMAAAHDDGEDIVINGVVFRIIHAVISDDVRDPDGQAVYMLQEIRGDGWRHAITQTEVDDVIWS